MATRWFDDEKQVDHWERPLAAIAPGRGSHRSRQSGLVQRIGKAAFRSGADQSALRTHKDARHRGRGTSALPCPPMAAPILATFRQILMAHDGITHAMRLMNQTSVDWNQGMTTYAMPLGSVFNLKFQWKVNGVIHESMLEDVQCASGTSGR